MVHFAREERAEHIHFFLTLRATETYFLPKTFKDIAKLLANSKKKWLESCLEKLKLLKNRDIYEIMDLPKEKKAVKCQGRTDGVWRNEVIIELYSRMMY